jgi:hypothetical protein
MSQFGAPVDVICLLCHSISGNLELRYSLRSVAANLPFVRKVWIFGDRPQWLAHDTAIVEHVGQDYVARALGCPTPVTNDLVMLFMASLIPGLAFDFVRFSDDYIVLQPLTREQLCTVRVQEDLTQLPSRGQGRFKEMLWRTHDILTRSGYPAHNFDDHVPMPYTKQTVFETFCAFRDFITHDRFQGMASAMAICNYAAKRHGLKFLGPDQPSFRAGFYGSCPSTSAEIAHACEGKRLLNFDDNAFGPAMIEFLEWKFPEPCKYEREGT